MRIADQEKKEPMGIEHFVRLGAAHRTAITKHLSALDAASRAFRFGTPVCDESIAKYVASINFECDIVEGVWDDEILVGVAHLAVYAEDGRAVGELGISVLPEARHQQLGQRLLARVLLHGKLKRLERVYVQFLGRNRPMARLARGFTNLVETNRGQAHATIDMGDPALIVA
jgi:GNAT superfamily N-acetyltransferase